MWTTKVSMSIWCFTEEVHLIGVQLRIVADLIAKSKGISSKLLSFTLGNQADYRSGNFFMIIQM